MFSGTPVVASRSGGIPEIIQHQRNGLLVSNYWIPSAFEKQILIIAQNNKKAKQMPLRLFFWVSVHPKFE